MAESKNLDSASAEFRAEIDKKLLRTVAADPTTANTKETYKALAFATR